MMYEIGNIVNMVASSFEIFEIIGTSENNNMPLFPNGVDYTLQGMDGITFKTVMEKDIELSLCFN